VPPGLSGCEKWPAPNFSVIPADAGIQLAGQTSLKNHQINNLDSGCRRNDGRLLGDVGKIHRLRANSPVYLVGYAETSQARFRYRCPKSDRLLDGGDDLNLPLARVEAAGGAVITPKTVIRPEIGCFAVFRDSEGNHVGLFSRG
jgi:hypothetical protein